MLWSMRLLSALICLRLVTALTYTGCYPSFLLEQAFDFQSSSASQAIEVCSGACSSHLYAALINGTECYCSDSFNTESERSVECEVRCAGNIIQTCGGEFSFQVFLHEELVSSISSSVSTAGLAVTSDTLTFNDNDTFTSEESFPISQGVSTLSTSTGVQNFTSFDSFSSTLQTVFSWDTMVNVTLSTESSSELVGTPPTESQMAETIPPNAAANEATQVISLDTSSDESQFQSQSQSSSQIIPTPSPSSAKASYIDSDGETLNTGTIVGIAIGCSSFLVIFGVVCYLIRRRRTAKSAQLPEDDLSVLERDRYVSEFVRNYVENYHQNGSILTSSSSQSIISSVDSTSSGPFGSGQVRRSSEDSDFEERREVLRVTNPDRNPDSSSENTFSTT